MWKDPVEGLGGGGGGDPPFKHIILGIDGTWQAAFSDVFQSNVFRMNVALNFRDKTVNKRHQVFVYQSGVGTMTNAGKYIAGGAGDGFDESVLHAYINLVSNYVPGDKIYIFGFSRGAVTARALTGFISHSGLLKANSAAHMEHAWNHFTGRKQNFNYASEIGNVAYQKVDIEFLGVWDTVSGPINQEEVLQRYRLYDLLLGKNIKHGVHILSIDEGRAAFTPIVWTGSSKRKDGQALEQIWLPGVHSDIGGGYEADFLATVSLMTMIDKLAEYCPDLSFDKGYIEKTLLRIAEDHEAVINDERKGFKFWKVRRRTGTETSQASVHPLFKLMRSRRVNVRGTGRPYNPPSWIGDALSDTQFPPNSWHGKKLHAILKEKFG
jgi:uncharacterized protein (DUF2235 family)